MLKMARLDAIIYRIGGANPCYVSEHDCSMARDKDFYRSLSRLKSQVRSDLASGFYSLSDIDYIRPFVTCVDTVLPLRDGSLKQSFIGCSYEAFDARGRHEFVSMCPTNYLSNEADTLLDSLKTLGEVIEARYLGERVNDLIRELPRAPLVTTFSLDGEERRPAGISAVIERDNGSFTAFSPEVPLRAKAGDPCEALNKLERALSDDPAMARGHLLRSDPIFGPVDVQLTLKNSFSIKRFLISLSPCKNGTRYYRAYAPQAGVSAKSTTIEGALQNIKDAISLKFHESPLDDVERALKSRPILTTARLGPVGNN
jgi:predicted RNase H-like HicB family nuclease